VVSNLVLAARVQLSELHDKFGGMSEATYSTAQIASLLKLTRAMVNKYALAVEDFSGKKIPQTAKDGRRFSTEDYQVIANAKSLVDSERVTLNTAVKMSLGQSDLVPTSPNASLVSSDTSQALEAIVSDNRAALEALVAANQANNELLLEEIRRLAGDRKELPSAAGEKKDSIEPATAGNDTRHGILVSAAMWIEKRLRGS
jgi:predicted transcriptional regulator